MAHPYHYVALRALTRHKTHFLLSGSLKSLSMLSEGPEFFLELEVTVAGRHSW